MSDYLYVDNTERESLQRSQGVRHQAYSQIPPHFNTHQPQIQMYNSLGSDSSSLLELQKDKRNLEIVNNELLKRQEHDRQTIMALVGEKQIIGNRNKELQDALQKAEAVIRKFQQNSSKNESQLEQLESHNSGLLRQLRQLEQNQNSVARVVVENKELAKQNQLLQNRLREVKDKAQNLALNQQDAIVNLKTKKTHATDALKNHASALQQLEAALEHKEMLLQKVSDEKHRLESKMVTLETLLEQRQIFIDDLKEQHEFELQERDERIKHTQDQAIAHLKQMKQTHSMPIKRPNSLTNLHEGHHRDQRQHSDVLCDHTKSAADFANRSSATKQLYNSALSNKDSSGQSVAKGFARKTSVQVQMQENKLGSSSLTAKNRNPKHTRTTMTQPASAFGVKQSVHSSQQETNIQSTESYPDQTKRQGSQNARKFLSADIENNNPNFPLQLGEIRFFSPKGVSRKQAPIGQRTSTNTHQWLKEQVTDAWRREIELKKYIRRISENCSDSLELKVTQLSRQIGYVNADVERWQMRNEEMEQHVQRAQEKCWSLKQVVLEQQKLIKSHEKERLVYQQVMLRSRNEAENAYSFAKYECNKYKQIVSKDGVLQSSQAMLQQRRDEAKEFQSKEKYFDDRVKKSTRIYEQLKIEFDTANSRIQALQTENDYLVDQMKRHQKAVQEHLHEVHEYLDPDGCINSVEASEFDTKKMIQQAARFLFDKINDFEHSLKNLHIDYTAQLREAEEAKQTLHLRLMQTSQNLYSTEEHMRLQMHLGEERNTGEYERVIDKLEIENKMLYQQISRLNEEILDLRSLEFQSMPREQRDREAYAGTQRLYQRVESLSPVEYSAPDLHELEPNQNVFPQPYPSRFERIESAKHQANRDSAHCSPLDSDARVTVSEGRCENERYSEGKNYEPIQDLSRDNSQKDDAHYFSEPESQRITSPENNNLRTNQTRVTSVNVMSGKTLGSEPFHPQRFGFQNNFSEVNTPPNFLLNTTKSQGNTIHPHTIESGMTSESRPKIVYGNGQVFSFRQRSSTQRSLAEEGSNVNTDRESSRREQNQQKRGIPVYFNQQNTSNNFSHEETCGQIRSKSSNSRPDSHEKLVFPLRRSPEHRKNRAHSQPAEINPRYNDHRQIRKYQGVSTVMEESPAKTSVDPRSRYEITDRNVQVGRYSAHSVNLQSENVLVGLDVRKQLQDSSRKIKSGLFDLVAEFRDKWEVNDDLKKRYDGLVKEMVMDGSMMQEKLLESTSRSQFESAMLAPFEQMVKFVGIIRDNLSYHNCVTSKKSHEITEKKETFTAGERELRKRCEIVLAAFKAGADKLARVDREWQEVIDSQVYVVEEILRSEDQQANYRNKGSGQTPLEVSLNDFRFTLTKAVEGLVSQEKEQVTQSQILSERGFDIKKLEKAQENSEIVKQLFEVYENATAGKRASIVSSGSINLKITNVNQFKSYSVSMLKALKEDLAKIHGDFVGALSNDVENYLRQKEAVRRMGAEELRLVIDRQNQEVLEMRTHELFLKRCTEQLEAFREAFEFCDVELASQCFPNCEGVVVDGMHVVRGGLFDQAAFNRKQQAKNFLKVLHDQIDSILKEAKALADEDGINFQTFSVSQLPYRHDNSIVQSHHIRKLMNERLVNLIQENGLHRKNMNKIAHIIRQNK